MRRLFSLLLFAAALSAASGEVRAAAVVYTFTGTVTDGFDATGVFLAPNHSFTGQAFTARFERDDATAGSVQTYDPGSSRIAGVGAMSPVLSTLTINSRTRSFGASRGRQEQSSVSCGPGCTDDSFRFKTENTFDGVLPASSLGRTVFESLIVGGTGVSILPGADYHSLPAFDAGSGIDFNGSFQIFDSLFYYYTGQPISREEAYGFFEVDSLTVTGLAPAPVPEPATWALMVLAFGGVGAVLRRGRGAVGGLPRPGWASRRSAAPAASAV